MKNLRTQIKKDLLLNNVGYTNDFLSCIKYLFIFDLILFLVLILVGWQLEFLSDIKLIPRISYMIYATFLIAMKVTSGNQKLTRNKQTLIYTSKTDR